MYFKFLQIALVAFIIYGCSGSAQIKKRYTPDDKTVFDLIERLKKNPNDEEAAKLLPEAYKQAADVRKSINSSTYNNMSAGDRWMEISKQLMVAQQMYTQIKANPAASKVVPKPWDPTLKIMEAKQKAADEYYNQGVQYMTYNNRPYAKKAYDMFVSANNAYPNYKDVKDQMAMALDKATIKVLVKPVNYNRFGWDYWGFQNDYLQYKMVRDLNNSSYSMTRFYTDADVNVQHVQADRVVELNFNDLFVGTVANDNYSLVRSKEIQTGQTNSVPPKVISQTVTATVYVTRRILESHASLACRIYDWASNSNILYDHFPGSNTWKQETARFTGDERALEPSDAALINNRSDDAPPSRNKIAQRLIDDCYSALLSRIKSASAF